MVTVTSRGSWTVPDVSALLLSFESRLEAARSSSINTDGSPSAHLAYTTPRNDSRPPMPRNNGRFSSFRGGRGRGRFNNGRLTCQLCHKPGHSADRCWNRFNQGFSPQANSRPLLPTPNFQQSAPSANLVHSRPHHGYQIPARSQPASSHPPSEYNFDASSITSWYPDFGATNHVSNDFTILNTATEYQGGNSLLLGNGVGINIAHIGSSHFKSSPHPASKSLFLHNLLHVPHISKNLLSVSQFALDNDVYFEFHSNFCLVKDRATKQVILKGTLENGLYHFHLHKVKSSMSSSNSHSLQHKSSSSVSDSSSSPSYPAIFSTSVISSLDVWHKRLGHSAFDMVEHALKSCNISYKSIKSSVLCHPCCIAKSHRLPYPTSNTSYTAPLQLIHTDLWGPSPVKSHNGFSYYITFIDQFTRFSWIYFLKAKSEVEGVFKHFKAAVENQFNLKIKMVQSDWGGEYRSLTKFFHDSGIHHRLSCPYTPQQNGLVERKNRHVVEMGLAMLAQSGLPSIHWDDAFSSAIYIINRLPTKTLNSNSPFEMLHHSKPNYNNMRVFGCLCYPFLRPYNHHKLEFRSSPATFLGYSSNHKGYKVLLDNGKVIISRDVIFDESTFPHLSKSSPSSQISPSPPFTPLTILSNPSPNLVPSSSSSVFLIDIPYSPRPSFPLR